MTLLRRGPVLDVHNDVRARNLPESRRVRRSRVLVLSNVLIAARKYGTSAVAYMRAAINTADQPLSQAWIKSSAMSASAVRRSPVQSAEVIAATALTPRMRRITIRSEALAGLNLRPAQDLELHLSETSGRRVKRRYTIRQHRPESGEADLDVLLHGDSPGSNWGAM